MQTSKKYIKDIFRKANKLEKLLVNSKTNPLGVPEYADVRWFGFLQSLSQELRDYFEARANKAVDIAYSRYHRPIVRGRDGLLYSAADMDDAMMCN